MLNTPAHKENESQTTLRFCLTPVRMAIIKNTTNVDEDVGKELLHTVGGNGN
jgi:hypothetical protein